MREHKKGKLILGKNNNLAVILENEEPLEIDINQIIYNNNIKREEILIVDDFWENITRAANNGFLSCTPMEVVNYICEGNKLF